MNFSYIFGGLMGLGLLGGLFLTSASDPVMPQRDFDFAAAGPQEQVDWLTAYGHFVHFQLEQTKRSDSTKLELVSIDPSIRAVSITSTAKGKNIDKATMDSEAFKKRLMERALDYQKTVCARHLKAEDFAGDTRVLITATVGNLSMPNIEVSRDICHVLQQQSAANKLFGDLKN